MSITSTSNKRERHITSLKDMMIRVQKEVIVPETKANKYGRKTKMLEHGTATRFRLTWGGGVNRNIHRLGLFAKSRN